MLHQQLLNWPALSITCLLANLTVNILCTPVLSLREPYHLWLNIFAHICVIDSARGNDLVRFQGFSEFGFFMIDDIALIPGQSLSCLTLECGDLMHLLSAGGPIPSGVFTRQRRDMAAAKAEKAKRENPDCPVGQKSCPISGLTGSSEVSHLSCLQSCILTEIISAF